MKNRSSRCLSIVLLAPGDLCFPDFAVPSGSSVTVKIMLNKTNINVFFMTTPGFCISSVVAASGVLQYAATDHCTPEGDFSEGVQEKKKAITVPIGDRY